MTLGDSLCEYESSAQMAVFADNIALQLAKAVALVPQYLGA